MRKNRSFFLCIFLCLVGLQSLFAQQTERIYLSGHGHDDMVEWDFFCTGGMNSGKWTKIGVPSCWEMQGFGTQNYGHDLPKAEEKGLYKKSFTVPKEWKGKKIYVVFEGSMTDTKVEVNGKQAGAVHQGSFYSFKRDISSLVKYGAENLLEVEVSKMSSNNSVNQAERKADFWVFGGLFRPVFLEVCPEKHIEYVAFDAKHTGAFTVDIHLMQAVKNATAELIVKDKSGKELGRFTEEVETSSEKSMRLKGVVKGIKAWSAEYPTLYKATVRLLQKGKVLHEIEENIGFRSIEVFANEGIYVNGIKMKFRGVNRHCHWVESGRTTSKRMSIEDVKLIKEMNMNAVRMSHYPPDKHFLEVCDSLGLYVIDELCSWHYPPYDTPVGEILVREMVVHDVNHPSIVLWANGNEDGFNYDFDPLFPQYDPQKREVLHPWDVSMTRAINTLHYIKYNIGLKNMFHGREIVLPTEILHGLYDGGHGAGLDDYWNAMYNRETGAGMFLWDFIDQAVVRRDKNNILDTHANYGADGILGPYKQKEGSFYTIKEIWSPVQLKRQWITPRWDGTLRVENRYDFTNLSVCSFRYEMIRLSDLKSNRKEKVSGTIPTISLSPKESGQLKMDLPTDWKTYDVLFVTATDRNGQDLFTWSYELSTPEVVASRLLGLPRTAAVSVLSEADCFRLRAAGKDVCINKETGLIESILADGKYIPLDNGPILIGREESLKLTPKATVSKDGKAITFAYSQKGKKYTDFEFTWRMFEDGLVELDYAYYPCVPGRKVSNIEQTGITFSFPEKDIKGAKLFANGPYRVYKNRLKGGSLNIWEKTYNNAITGESWDYPEFKGYYSLFYAMHLECPTPFEVYSGTQDLFLHLFTPERQKGIPAERNFTYPNYPSGNISFLDAIPAIGTKFAEAYELGPQSEPYRYQTHSKTPSIKNKLYFRF